MMKAFQGKGTKVSPASHESEDLMLEDYVDDGDIPPPLHKTDPKVSYNDEQKLLFRLQFDKYDADGSGKISLKEYRKVMEDFGVFQDEHRLAADMAAVDLNNDGNIEFEEFCVLLNRYMEKPDPAKLKEAFYAFEVNEDGEVSTAEFRNALETVWGKSFSASEIDEIMDLLDKDSDGTLNFEEFLAFVNR